MRRVHGRNDMDSSSMHLCTSEHAKQIENQCDVNSTKTSYPISFVASNVH